MTTTLRRTKILATLGPATDAPGVLDALLTAGVDVVRLNFSHGDPSSQIARANAVREAAQRVGTEVGILADLPGPKIRIERFAEGRVLLKAGDRFDLVARADLDQAELRIVGLLAHELRVDGGDRGLLERRDEPRERRVVVDPAYFLRCGHRRSSLSRRLRYHPWFVGAETF